MAWASRSTAEESSPLAWPLMAVTRLAVRWPRSTLALAVVLALASILYAFARLELRTSRLDLLNPESGYNKLWLEFIKEFGDEDDVVVVVEGQQRDEVIAGVEAVHAEIARHTDSFHSMLQKVDLEKLRAKGLHYLSTDELEPVDHFLASVTPVLEGDWASLGVGRLAAALPDEAASPARAAQSMRLLDLHAQNLTAALAGSDDYVSPWAALDPLLAAGGQLQTHYLLAGEGRMGLVLLRLKDDGSSFARGSAAIDELRRLLARVQARHPGVSIGLSGLPIMENDEMRSSQMASLEASAISLVGVSLLFVAGFGGLRHPLLAVAALVLGIAWTCGYLTVSVGHLNILSMSFGMILIGLGIDFGVHYIARYLQLRETEERSGQALVKAAGCVGPGIVTGGATTAIAFFAAVLTDFTGVVELGVIAGGGILLCMLAALIVLPALIELSDGGRPAGGLPRPLSVTGALALPTWLPLPTIIFSLLVTAVFCSGLGRLWYDHNLLNLQPVGLESVRLERRLLERSDQSVWYAVSIADSRDELLARAEQFRQLPSVQRTEEIVSLLPPEHAEKTAAIQSIADRLSHLPDRPPLLEVEPPGRLAQRLLTVAEHTGAAGAGGDAAVAPGDNLRRAAVALADAPEAAAFACLSRYQQRVAEDLLGRLRALGSMSDPAAPAAADLPKSLVDRFVGRTGKHLLKVYGQGNIWNMDSLTHFVQQVRRVDPHATGKPLQTYEASRHMQRSYLHTALYALIAICIVLVLDFQSLYYSMLALLPVGLGLLQLFGLLGLLGIPLNPANMIVLPLVLGIGLDDGVHVVHDFRTQQGRFRLSRSTGTAVVLTSLTTMVGFGSMMIADHRGLQSLGRVLTIGVSCCLFTSLVPLPALLAWLTRRRPEHTAAEPQDAEPGERPEDTAGSRSQDTWDEPWQEEEEPAEVPLATPRRRSPLDAHLFLERPKW